MSEENKKVKQAIKIAKSNTELNVSNDPKYSKAAFIKASKDSKERLILNVLLEDEKSYTKDEVSRALKTWKVKKLKEAKA